MDRRNFTVTRRTVMQGAGALMVSGALPMPALAQAAKIGVAERPAFAPTELSSWLSIGEDGRVAIFFGKMDMGQGVDTALAQIVAEELDVEVDAVDVVMGDSGQCLDQGGASGSTGLQRGAIPHRNAAAQARQVLLERAAELLGANVSELAVEKGVVSVGGDASRSVSYADMIGGNAFDVRMEWNGKTGNSMSVSGTAKPKDPSQYRVVGQPHPRRDAGPKVFGTLDYVTEVKVPGMVHARMVLPKVAGATPVSVDEASIAHIPGARVVREGDLVAVVADREWDAIRAAEALEVEWSDAEPPFPDQAALYDHIRGAPVSTAEAEVDEGDALAALEEASRVIEAEFEWPFQSHASMGPACAVVAIEGDRATLWTGSQKSHEGKYGVAAALGLPEENVRAIWVPGPGSYGRNDAGDASVAAAIIARAAGRPVRLQGMRHEGTGWDPKGPASVHHGRAALDENGEVLAYHYRSKAFSRQDMRSREGDPSHTLAGMMVGFPLKPNDGFRVPEESYAFANKRTEWEVIPPLLDRASPLRTSHLRDPGGPQVQFGSEQFIDEVAEAAGLDPVQFRLKHVTDERDAAVIRAAAERSGWTPRVGPANPKGAEGVLRGRGIAYAQRNAATVAIVAEVEVDTETGRVWPRKMTVAHECGLIVNPKDLRHTIEGNIVQGLSRAMLEEVAFDDAMVTSVDWVSYPILETPDAPEEIDIVLLDRTDLNPRGAGEASIRPVAAAVANAIYDATGVRVRRAPLTRENVLRALGRG